MELPKSKVNPDGAGSVSMSEFIRTRDSVVTGLTKLNGAIGTLISAYVNHTNTLLTSSGQNEAVLDTKQLTEYLTSAGLAGPIPNGETPGGKDKKKRPKKEKDPNAPKRPLTAFFLFSTRARDHIKNDLGPDATPVQINDEILRRWNEMDAPQKDRWKGIYNQNYEEYKKQVEAYRQSTGQDLPVEPVDHDAVADPALLEAAAGAEDSDEASTSDEEEAEPVKEPTPPPAKKTKAASKKKKGAAAEASSSAAPAVTSPSPSAQLQAPARSTTAIPLPTGPAEKRKKAAKEESPEQPKKKKSRKSEAAAAAAAAAPAPAPAPVATPAEKKKKKSKKNEA